MPGIPGPGDMPPGDMPGEPGIPGMPPNCAAAGQSGTTASTHANGRARLSVITVVPGRSIRPLDPAAPPINSPLNSAITRQNSGPGRSVLSNSDAGRTSPFTGRTLRRGGGSRPHVAILLAGRTARPGHESPRQVANLLAHLRGLAVSSLDL